MTAISRKPNPYIDMMIKEIRPKETWIEKWGTTKGYTVIRGTEQKHIPPTPGIPDYYIIEKQCFIEEKRNLKDKLQPHQLIKCMEITQQNYNVSIALRDSGAIIPFLEYLKIVEWPKTWGEEMGII
jgi:hypothetical protein